MKTVRLARFCVVLHLVTLFSQSSHAVMEDSPQLWSAVFLNHDIGSKFGVFIEVQNRFAFDIKHNERLLLRPALYCNLTQKISFWAGYGWIPLFAPTFKDEQRPWQQVQLNNFFKLPFSNLFRFRLEERVIEGVNQVSLRSRTMAKLQYAPIKNLPDWSLILSDEVFFNLNTVSASIDQGFDQNRVFLGLGYKFSDHMKTEFGYLYNYINRTSPNDCNIHAMVMSLFWKI